MLSLVRIMAVSRCLGKSLTSPLVQEFSNGSDSNQSKSPNHFVWHKTEHCLLDAEADVFLIFDWLVAAP